MIIKDTKYGLYCTIADFMPRIANEISESFEQIKPDGYAEFLRLVRVAALNSIEIFDVKKLLGSYFVKDLTRY
jgi:hypothetical protein